MAVADERFCRIRSLRQTRQGSAGSSPRRIAPTRGEVQTAIVAQPKRRGVDHIGFEVKNLDAFVKNFEAQAIKMDAAVRQLPGTELKIAFVTDPYGTYIELTEGLQPKR
jgi:hypothetical protein